MAIKLDLHADEELKPKIAVFGVGGGGVNAINNMVSSNLEGVDFFAANTDMQALEGCLAQHKVKLGVGATKGLGAGSDPEIGRIAAEEAVDEILEVIDGYNMIFITAGMGGGTGTGAAPVVAKLARERGILTIGVATKPFYFEGARRTKIAEIGLDVLQDNVDTLIIIPNQNLFRLANEKTTFADAFKMVDSVLHQAVRGVTDLLTNPGLINLDFADIKAVMNEKGKAMMGTGEASEENRAVKAAEAAISNPLLDHSSMKGARGVLINITGGMDMTLFEVDEVANRIKEEVDDEANIIFGSAFNPDLEGKIRVSVVATGIDVLVPRTTIEDPSVGSIFTETLNKRSIVERNTHKHEVKHDSLATNKKREYSSSSHSAKTLTRKEEITNQDNRVPGRIINDPLYTKSMEPESGMFDIPTFLRNKKKV